MSAFKKVKALVVASVPQDRFIQVPVPNHPAYSKGDLIFRWQDEHQLGNYITVYTDFKGYKTWGISYLWNIEQTVPLLKSRPSIWWPRFDPFEKISDYGEIRARHIAEGVDEWITSDERMIPRVVPEVIGRVLEKAPNFFASVNQVLRRRLSGAK